MKEIIKLSDDKMKEIYTDQKFRNNVAFAHVCCDAHGTFQHRKTCSHPIEYIVTNEQIKEATNELNRAKNETFELNKNNLLFVGMGTDYSERYFDDVCNHRVRTEFINSEGKRYFIEVGTGRDGSMICNHAIDRDLEIQKNNELNIIYDKCTAYRAENKTNFISKELSEARRVPLYF